METRNLYVSCIVGQEENWAIEFVVWVEYFCAREAIPPGLAVAINDARAGVGVDLDVPIVS